MDAQSHGYEKEQYTGRLSTSYAEYRPIADVLQRAVYTRNLLGTLHNDKPTVIFAEHNQPALDMVNALGDTTRSKFIDLRTHYIKDETRENKIALKHMRSEEQDADIFTKAMGRG